MKLFQNIRHSSRSVWNNFISGRGNLPEIIWKLFHRIIAAHEYFPTCSGRWNNCEIISELFQRPKEFYFTCDRGLKIVSCVAFWVACLLSLTADLSVWNTQTRTRRRIA